MRLRNLDLPERVLRVSAGMALLAVGWWGEEVLWAVSLRVVALYPLVTGVMGWCPIVALLRLGRSRARARPNTRDR